ncbi:MAG: Serine/threonine-protein kinase pkn1, partial [Verrucomicrobiota bacterium]
GPGTGDIRFQHDGGEMIFNLPNGLQGYLLTDAEGNRIDAGPQKIVIDRTALAGTEVINGISCMKCHASGMIPVADEVRPRLDRTPGTYPANFHQTITRLYPGNARLNELLTEDRNRFLNALKEANAEQGSGPEPISELVRRFLRGITIETAHAEVGLPATEFRQRLLAPALTGVRHDLEQSDVSRDNFIANFRLLTTELQLGVPRVPRSGDVGKFVGIFAGPWTDSNKSTFNRLLQFGADLSGMDVQKATLEKSMRLRFFVDGEVLRARNTPGQYFLTHNYTPDNLTITLANGGAAIDVVIVDDNGAGETGRLPKQK